MTTTYSPPSPGGVARSAGVVFPSFTRRGGTEGDGVVNLTPLYPHRLLHFLHAYVAHVRADGPVMAERVLETR